jgi:hypothetical protein
MPAGGNMPRPQAGEGPCDHGTLGAVEGLNNKLKLITTRSYGFRSFRMIEVALYHNLGRLPEPEGTHRFC